MKRRKTAKVAPQRIIKMGGLYRDTVRGVTVTAEDHEMRDGHRTGRIIVCAADGKVRFPRRWYCDATDLAEVQCELPSLVPNDDGVRS
jgi:hypothetical protein